jgi:hypothetical protein
MLDKVFKYLSLSKQVNLIGLILLLLFFSIRNPASKWDKTISGDGKSYYAYLTTAFIYHDLDYHFVDDYEAKYYPPDRSLYKEFRQEIDGEISNKTFPGISLLWLPFFLIAHFLSFLFGFATDGYSILYQYAIGLAAVFYVWLGIKWLSKLFISLGYSKKLVVPVIIALIFGTNLFYYTIHDPSLTHAYNFTLLVGILYFSRRFFLEQNASLLAVAVSLFVLAVITRPTNALMLIFIPFAFHSLIDLKVFLLSIIKSKKHLIISISISIILLLYPIIWWYVQTGHFIIYAYGNEGFDFTNPHIFQILFSYEKGWLVYTPMIFLTVLGFMYYYKRNTLLFYNGLVGFIILAYVFSCWWIWTYGASFGQRVFVDYYAIVGILLIAGFTLFAARERFQIFLSILIASLISLNLFQTYQFKNGILPSIGATSETYWGSYFKLKSIRPSYPVTKPYTIIQQYKTDFESDTHWLTIDMKTDLKASSGTFSQFINHNSPYSGGFKGKIPAGADFIQITLKVYCESNSASPQLIYELGSNANNTLYHSKGLMPYLEKNKWTTVYFTISLEDNSRTNLTTYVYNPTDDNIWIDDLEITFGKHHE